MVNLAASGLRVVRLKGGDPLIFGRAGEEIESLRRNNIPFEIVPGVTSVLGAAAAAQIPLTHRQASSAVVFLTAHRSSEDRSEHRSSNHLPSEYLPSKNRLDGGDDTDWSKFVASGATLVIYMPGQNYAEIASKLMSAGLAGDVACAVISRATTKQQQTHRTTVLDLHRAPRLASPTLLVVGEVVRLSDPAAVEEWAVPGVPIGIDTRLPATLFKTFPPLAAHHRADEERTA